MYSDRILKILTEPPEIDEDHQILGAGGPLGQFSRKLISNPDIMPATLQPRYKHDKGMSHLKFGNQPKAVAEFSAAEQPQRG